MFDKFRKLINIPIFIASLALGLFLHTLQCQNKQPFLYIQTH